MAIKARQLGRRKRYSKLRRFTLSISRWCLEYLVLCAYEDGIMTIGTCVICSSTLFKSHLMIILEDPGVL